jgi:hypothetical protein
LAMNFVRENRRRKTVNRPSARQRRARTVNGEFDDQAFNVTRGGLRETAHRAADQHEQFYLVKRAPLAIPGRGIRQHHTVLFMTMAADRYDPKVPKLL